MAISINSNQSAARAQRQLGTTSNNLSRTFERLASGSRINRASDDAAGLSIDASLRVDARVAAVVLVTLRMVFQLLLSQMAR
jgi:flagellin-like hook-associated protein FlgL